VVPQDLGRVNRTQEVRGSITLSSTECRSLLAIARGQRSHPAVVP
jgi:hypothetical protein